MKHADDMKLQLNKNETEEMIHEESGLKLDSHGKKVHIVHKDDVKSKPDIQGTIVEETKAMKHDEKSNRTESHIVKHEAKSKYDIKVLSVKDSTEKPKSQSYSNVTEANIDKDKRESKDSQGALVDETARASAARASVISHPVQFIPENSLNRSMILTEAISRHDGKLVTATMTGNQNFISGWIGEEETALLCACSCGDYKIVKYILGLMSDDIREITRFRERTPLGLAVTAGNLEVVKLLHKKYKDIANLPVDSKGKLPLFLAVGLDKKEIANFLYNKTSNDRFKEDHHYLAVQLLHDCISHKIMDIALEVFKNNDLILAVLKHPKATESAMTALAKRSDLFQIPENLGFWKGLLYNSCVHINPPIFKYRHQLSVHHVDTASVLQGYLQCFLKEIAKPWPKLFGQFDNLHALKMNNWVAREILQEMVQKMESKERRENGIGEIIYEAVKCGNRHFVADIMKRNSALLWDKDNVLKSNFLMLAVVFRQASVFSMYYGLDHRRNILLAQPDGNGNMILEVVAQHEVTPTSYSVVAPLELQRQLQWFKEIERLVPVSERERTGKDGLTPWKLLEKNYENLRVESEAWMKAAAGSCSVISILIATIAFPAIFTFPGGVNSETGEPVKKTEGSFNIFMLMTMLAFLFGSTATFLFLGILTTRHSIEDYYRKLPTVLLAGQFTLSLSVVTITFYAALYMFAHLHPWYTVPVILLILIHAAIFIWLQLPVALEMLRATYWGLFSRTTTPWL